jgi:anti-sigma regulatory factor (Ser/Thr protein kinase)
MQYNPLEKEDPDITLSAEERDIGGLGIFLTRKTMDEVHYEYRDGSNILTMKKKI